MSDLKLVSLSFHHVYNSVHECYIIFSLHVDLYSLLSMILTGTLAVYRR